MITELRLIKQRVIIDAINNIKRQLDDIEGKLTMGTYCYLDELFEDEGNG